MSWVEVLREVKYFTTTPMSSLMFFTHLFSISIPPFSLIFIKEQILANINRYPLITGLNTPVIRVHLCPKKFLPIQLTLIMGRGREEDYNIPHTQHFPMEFPRSRECLPLVANHRVNPVNKRNAVRVLFMEFIISHLKKSYPPSSSLLINIRSSYQPMGRPASGCVKSQTPSGKICSSWSCCSQSGSQTPYIPVAIASATGMRWHLKILPLKGPPATIRDVL